MVTVRSPAVTGLFYPADSQQLAEHIEQLLSAAQPHKSIPKALIVPHAGYIYSVAIAASAYVTLYSFAECVRRVILLGPAHRVAVRGLALPDVNTFTSPLGQMMIDTAAITDIIHLPQVTVSPQAHALEHSLEVQLPFLQSTLTDFSIVPLVVGMSSAEEVTEVLDCLWGSEETLIIVSSDLSHYLPYAIAQREDSKTVSSILQLNHSRS
jgi:AmmeMemoRadiSam system protein B